MVVRRTNLDSSFYLTVYEYLKTLIIMANYEIRFKCNVKPDDYIKTEVFNTLIEVSMFIENDYYDIILDKSTAIKFAKTLRTEINKIQD